MNPPWRTWGWAEVFAILSAASAGFFAVLALGVAGQGAFAGEADMLTWLHSQANPALDEFFILLTHIGDAVLVAVAAAVLVAYFIYKKLYKKAGVVLLLVGGSVLLNIIFKLLFHRARPELWEHLLHETGFSFPSGHVMMSTSFLASIVITMWDKSIRWIILCAAVVLALVVGISRLYIGVHYPTDVLAGWSVVLTLAFAIAAVYAKTAKAVR